MKHFFAFLLLALAVVACGKKGNLDVPKGSTYPYQYPKQRQPVVNNNSILYETQDVDLP